MKKFNFLAFVAIISLIFSAHSSQAMDARQEEIITQMRDQLVNIQNGLDLLQVRANETEQLAQNTFWDTGIDMTHRHIQNLQRDNLNVNELEEIAGNLMHDYSPLRMIDLCHDSQPDIPTITFLRILNSQAGRDIYQESIQIILNSANIINRRANFAGDLRPNSPGYGRKSNEMLNSFRTIKTSLGNILEIAERNRPHA